MKFFGIVAAAASVALLVSGCASAEPEATANRAVVIVSGGGAVSPFTTPTEYCTGGLSAGNTDTAMREYLLKQGKKVYTAPAMDTWGTVVEPAADSLGAFGDCPEPLGEQYTIMSAGDINASGEKLARFVNFLHDEYAVNAVDFVGHSNGGLYSRAAIRVLKQTDAPVTVKSLTMVGTPNTGSFPSAYSNGEIGIEECQQIEFCVNFNTTWLKYVGDANEGLDQEDTAKFLNGAGGWNEAQAGYLDGIPVVMLGGSRWSSENGNPEFWPYDGIVPVYSALAEGVSDSVIPHRACWTAPLTHSIFVSTMAELDWETALTWNTEALARINQAIDESDTALKQPNRLGC